MTESGGPVQSFDGRHIRTIREAYGIHASHVAALLGVSRQRIHQIENSRLLPTATVQRYLAAVYVIERAGADAVRSRMTSSSCEDDEEPDVVIERDYRHLPIEEAIAAAFDDIRRELGIEPGPPPQPLTGGPR